MCAFDYISEMVSGVVSLYSITCAFGLWRVTHVVETEVSVWMDTGTLKGSGLPNRTHVKNSYMLEGLYYDILTG